MIGDSDFPLVGRGSSKWNGAADAGFTIVPDVLITKQAELGLTTTELVVLLQIVTFWWAADRPPFPPTSVIARRMGVEMRTVQRALSKLQKKGLIERRKLQGNEGRTVKVWTLDGLVARLNAQVATDPILLRRAQQRRTQTDAVQPPMAQGV